MPNEEISNTHHDCESWRNSSGLALILMIVSFIIFIVIACMTTGEFETKPTHIILKTEECGFLSQYGIVTTNSAAGNSSCAATVPYRINTFGSGGLIVIENGPQIKIPDSQVILVGSIENQPWTTTQTRTAILLGASSLFMLLMMIWFFMLIFSSNSES